MMMKILCHRWRSSDKYGDVQMMMKMFWWWRWCCDEDEDVLKMMKRCSDDDEEMLWWWYRLLMEQNPEVVMLHLKSDIDFWKRYCQAWVQVISRWTLKVLNLKEGLFQISKRPGPGTWIYKCNATTHHETSLSGITLKSLYKWTHLSIDIHHPPP